MLKSGTKSVEKEEKKERTMSREQAPTRMGKFNIKAEFIKKSPEIIAQVFAFMKCIPVRAEYLYELDEITYLAMAEIFDEVPYNMAAPPYILEIDQDDEGNVTNVIAKPTS
jgi:hypothetical protein